MIFFLFKKKDSTGIWTLETLPVPPSPTSLFDVYPLGPALLPSDFYSLTSLLFPDPMFARWHVGRSFPRSSCTGLTVLVTAAGLDDAQSVPL